MDKAGDIVVVKLKIPDRKKVLNIAQITGDEVIHGNHLVAFVQKAFAEVRTQKACAAGNQYSFFH
jgi:hypothetical protein